MIFSHDDDISEINPIKLPLFTFVGIHCKLYRVKRSDVRDVRKTISFTLLAVSTSRYAQRSKNDTQLNIFCL